MTSPDIPGFQDIPKTGVIYVMSHAKRFGYDSSDSTWANLGQGSPEVGPLPDAPERIETITIPRNTYHYGPVLGTKELRQKVADFYNTNYRKDKSSQYTYENVAICNGGRLALTRILATLGNINLGHFIPDYTAYEELLSVFKAFTPIPILGDHTADFHITSKNLSEEILGRGLSALLLSNPCNPTGQVLQGGELRKWISLARELECSMLFDEFYSHYIYDAKDNKQSIVSSARHVEDIESDPIIIIDGLTKNWRYPGLRLSWTLGPKSVIEKIGSAGSFIDGGANHPFQREAIHLLDQKQSLKEITAIQNTFIQKRDFVIDELTQLGIRVEKKPAGTFYVWANLSDLPTPLNDGMKFFKEGLKEKFITVPGVFFDVNPGHRRQGARYQSYARISFGPSIDELKVGLASMARLIKKHNNA